VVAVIWADSAPGAAALFIRGQAGAGRSLHDGRVDRMFAPSTSGDHAEDEMESMLVPIGILPYMWRNVLIL
jgi:hypothetical protein